VIRQIALLGAALIAAAPLCTHSAARVYAIEPTRTVVTFEVTGIAQQRGVFDSVSGRVLLDPTAGTGTVDIVVNAQSVRTSHAAAETILRGKSFLNIERYSEIDYRAGRVAFVRGKPSRIEGELTLLGITKPVPLSISNYTCADEAAPDDTSSKPCVLDAIATFKRSEFGMRRYMAFVGDNVTLVIHSVTMRL